MCLVLPIFRPKNNYFAKECGTSMASQESLCQPIQLEPFIHQVGGSSSMLELDNTTICKPLIPREQLFYETLPESMQPYTPEYRGVIEVRFVEDNDGFLKVTAFASQDVNLTKKSSTENTKNAHTSVTKCRIKVSRSGKVEIVSNQPESGNSQIFDEDCVSENRRRSIHNPWVLHCHREQLSKIQQDTNSSIVYTQKYILLENLTSKYQYPCVLDLKMGTRQYGDDAPLSKRLTQDAKVKNTTSAKLGLRICGMQVYHLSDSHFLCHNKYYGRALTADGFKQTLIQFLHNGEELREELFSPLIERLANLEEVINTLQTFRFFTSSLLIIYDGQDPSERNCNANSNQDESKQDHECSQADNRNPSIKENLDEESNSSGKAAGDNANLEQASEGSKCLTTNSTKYKTASLPLVDVRMIDFAHSTFSGMPGDKIVHRGPDEGYLFGLENLTKQLKIIQKEFSNP